MREMSASATRDRLAPMSLKTQLRDDLTTAMKARDAVRVRTLRAVLTAITQAEVSGTEAHDLDDQQITDIVVREAKTRRESLVAYEGAGREDLASKEREELDVLADYLPQALSADEIREVVTKAIDDLGVRDQGMKAMGRVMGVVTPLTKGRADGGAVASEVRAQLS